MDLASFSRLVEDVLDQVRSSLVAIEDAAQVDDDPRLLLVSQRYARLVPPLRDYLAAAERGRPLPRTLAQRLQEALPGLREMGPLVHRLGLHPDVDEWERLVAEAGRVA